MNRSQHNETPMTLIDGSGLKSVQLQFGKGANRVTRTFKVGQTTMVPNHCVPAALKSKIVQEVKEQNAN